MTYKRCKTALAALTAQRLLRKRRVNLGMEHSTPDICTTNARLQAQAGAVWLVDVREAADAAALALDVPGVINLPWSQLAQRWQELPRDRPWVLVCLDGRQSAAALAFLQAQGAQQVSAMHGGMLLWLQKGYPVRGKRFTSLDAKHNTPP